MDTYYQALKLVTDYMTRPKDFVKLCLVNKSLYADRRNALLALEATRPDGHEKYEHHRASIISVRFKNPDVWKGLNEIWKFHAQNEILKLFLDTEQTEAVENKKDGRKLCSTWRPILRKLVNLFYERCKLMRRPFPELNNYVCYFDVECTDANNLSGGKLGVGNWIFDDDMVIFESVTVFHISNANNITDQGINKLVSAEEIFLSRCNKIRGLAFTYLHASKKLYKLTLVGLRGEHLYDKETIRYLEKPPLNHQRSYRNRPVPLLLNSHIDFGQTL